MEKNTITQLFEDVALYEEREFRFYTKLDEVYSIIRNEDLKIIYDYLGLKNKSSDKLITNCLDCNGNFPFILQLECRDNAGEIAQFTVGKYSFPLPGSLSKSGKGVAPLIIDFYCDYKDLEGYKLLNTTLNDVSYYLDYYFTCTNNESHVYKMSILLAIKSDKLIIQKVGQYPEATILGKFDGERYKNILRRINDSYCDYKNAEKSYKYGLHSGAYVYLRRVYENMINYYISKNKDKDTPIFKSTEEKINYIKNCFDEKIRDYLNPLYSALSCGIHVMKDSECEENYKHLKTVLDIQLQYMKSNDEIEEKVRESSKALSELNQKYGRKKEK